MISTEEKSMYKINWKKEILTIPNLISLFRLLLIPVYIVLYLNAEEVCEYYSAGAILAVSCLTDLIDGKIARSFNMISNLGKLLDPFADKLTQFSVTLCLCLKYPVLLPVLILIIAKETFQLVAFTINIKKGKALDGALLSGKICTTILFLTLTVLVFFPTISSQIVNVIAIVDSCFLLGTFLCYIFAFFGKHAQVKDLEPKSEENP